LIHESPASVKRRCTLAAEMARISAGLLMYRLRAGTLEVLLAHPGGPLFARKDEGAWTIPKGLVEAGEDLLQAAQREFEEETGVEPRGPYLPLTHCKLKAGKIVHAWAFAGDMDPAALRSNTFELEWPPRSGRTQRFHEIDRVAFFDADSALNKINSGQRGFVEELSRLLQSA
jgi:predicted NUDIX family NTP pyrophosphohydrolase